MDKVNSRALTETTEIKVEVQSTIAFVKKIDQGQRLPIETPKNEVESLKRGMKYAPCIEQCSEDMDSALTPVLKILVQRMKHLEINTRTVGGGEGIVMSVIAAIEDKWEGQLNKVTDRIYGMAVFPGGRWF